jgi:hypothetical protein
VSEEQALVLARALNDLYGIENDELCRRLENLAASALSQVLLEDLSCSVDEDCTRISNGTACSSGCGALVAVAALDAIEASLQSIDGSICEARRAAECDPHMEFPCIQAPNEVACIDGTCGTRPIEDAEPDPCTRLDEAACMEADGECLTLYAWQFDEATGTCPGRGFVQCVAAGNACADDSGFMRGPDGQCWWSEQSKCDGVVVAQPDPSCGEGDPSMSGCGIH